jgi:hypothetical protein
VQALKEEQLVALKKKLKNENPIFKFRILGVRSFSADFCAASSK